jgi:hypothetical protein
MLEGIGKKLLYPIRLKTKKKMKENAIIKSLLLVNEAWCEE